MPSLLCRRVIRQLDDLVVFMGLREELFFRQLIDRWSGLPVPAGTVEPPASFDAYEQLVLQSALLLGVSYAEAYFADALREVLRRQPRILASRQKHVSWECVVKSEDLSSLVDGLIEKELLEFTHSAIEGMLDYLADQLKIGVLSGDDRAVAKEGSIVRNLITHNGSLANNELANMNDAFNAGAVIRLSAGLVHRYGLAGRSLIRRVDEQLVEKYNIAADSPDPP
ncbi:MAG: hypothetical protein CHACPFDD_03599 [Phycisphaerae bacterium]|nr:hypothetical protein [Phycisphaerae bacterium]